MAAAVYLHNALFGQPSSRTSVDNVRGGQQDEDDSDDEEDADESSSLDDDGGSGGGDRQGDASARADGHNLGSSRAPSSSSPISSSRFSPVNTDDRAVRTLSVSSQGTLVPVTGGRNRHSQSRPLDSPHDHPLYIPSPEPLGQLYPPPLSQQQRSTAPSSETHAFHSDDNNTSTAVPYPEEDQIVEESTRSSPLPPGLPASTHRTSSSRRPLTPYPFPPLDPSPHSPSHTRGRPKGRRREDEEQEQEQPPKRASTFGRRTYRPYTPPHLRKGRIPNISLSRNARILILAARFLLALVLCGWSAYSCARYWLAYSEFRPDNSANNTTVEDPPRSQYAFVLALTCTVATALLVLDSAYFMYFVLYPHDGRFLTRIPTVAPISRPNEDEPVVVVNDNTDDTDGSPRPHPRPRSSRGVRVPVQLQDNDKFTAMPYRNSGFSVASSYRRSRRLSKPRPDSWAVDAAAAADAYPPSPEREAEREPAPVPETEDAVARTQENEGERVEEPVQDDAPPSRFVAPTVAPGEESDPPQVEKHSKKTYQLHLPTLCHEPSISPLPFPPRVAPSQQHQHQQPYQSPAFTRHRRRKWRRTRVFLHVVHWLAFIALNIPGFVNVALIPVWYSPEPTIDPSNNGSNVRTGINSPHRLSGLCDWSPDAIWAGTALPPSHPPPCAQTIGYKAWLWGAIGRVLITFIIAGAWIVMDGVWWGAWVVGTRRIGWSGAFGCPWFPRLQKAVAPTKAQHYPPQEHEEDSEEPRVGEAKEMPWAKRIRLLSGASRASGKSGRSSKSHKEKSGELVVPVPPPPAAGNTAQGGVAAIGVAGGITTFGVDPQDALATSAPKHKVRRKPVSTIGVGPTDAYSLNSPPLPASAYAQTYYEPSKLPGGGIGSRRPSAQESIGGSTMVGSPPGATFLPSSPVFTPASPHTSFSEHTSFANAGRRSMGLEIVPEQESRSSDEREAQAREDSPEMDRRYPDRPQSRLARYDDVPYRPNAPSPPSPSSPTYPPSPTRPGWNQDPNTFSPITSPGADAPLLGRGYFMVGDGGFSAGNANDGAYDEESYYQAMSEDARVNQANRAISPNSERSNSPNSFGQVVDTRGETPPNGRDEEESPEPPQLIPNSQGQWAQTTPYQHPLAMGIQMAMGQPPEFEREVRMLGTVVRRMSTIESLGSHERELSRRGSAATARTTQTGRGNSSGAAQREGTNGSGNSGPLSPLTATTGNGNGGQSERTETEPIIGAVRANSPVDISPP
ncbi:hypothetical protein M408DRAFT_332088 [Serendipita vermifera MAFF 305830]|uniref:Uncharacterized protein n=1 Tax=Serendipita vermifera MAFF 305830 TaxID=933852 RepID=A0A0C3AV38_SERVB|nr:hypothetical protein M408DRAFT_332088 [Serendipita vermifera MAFF 305830]